jgi:hypothetical protein
MTPLQTIKFESLKKNSGILNYIFGIVGVDIDEEEMRSAILDYPDPFDFQEWLINNGYEALT